MDWQDISFLQKKWIRISALILANFMTFGSIALSITGIVLTFVEPDNFAFWFAKIMAVCSIFDFTDGKLARIAGSRKLAVDIDTIVDSVSFGIFPAIYIGYTVSKWENIGIWNIVIGVLTGLIFLTAVWFRLFRFIKRDPLHTPYFTGLPSPFAGMVIACLVIFPNTQPWVMMVSTIIISGFMISKIPFPSFKGVPTIFDWFWIATTAISVFLFAIFPFSPTNLMIYPAYIIATLMVIYLTISPGYAMKLEKKLDITRKDEKEE